MTASPRVSPSPPRIAVLLPPREQVRQERSGAVALTVRDLTRYSRFRDRITVFGGGASDVPGIDFEALSPNALSDWWHRRSYSYARCFLQRSRQIPFSHVEVHNRPYIFELLGNASPPDLLVCLHLHNDPQEMRGLRSPAERRAAITNAAAVYCASHYIRRRLLDGVGGSADNVHVVHHGLEIPKAAPRERQKIILYVGRVISEKGVLELARALGRIRGQLRGWKIVVIGDAGTGRRLAYENQVNDALAVFGDDYRRVPFLPHPEVMQHFAAAEITVVPSRWEEPFGRTALEAMAAASAVVASGSGGLKEVVGDAGVIVDSLEPDALADAILGLVVNDEARRERQRRGYARAAQEFDIRVIAARLDRLREEIRDRRFAAAGGAPPPGR
jgi:glycosyltransferase involved in cell wall biosynthesis